MQKVFNFLIDSIFADDYENKFININGTYQMNEVDLPEKLCSEHIASLVNLKWQLPATDTQVRNWNPQTVIYDDFNVCCLMYVGSGNITRHFIITIND